MKRSKLIVPRNCSPCSTAACLCMARLDVLSANCKLACSLHLHFAARTSACRQSMQPTTCNFDSGHGTT